MINPVVNDVLDAYHEAVEALMRGDPQPLKDMFSHSEDAIWANAPAPPTFGWDRISRALDGAHARTAEGMSIDFQSVSDLITEDEAHIVEIEKGFRGESRTNRSVLFTSRTTSIFRLEEQEWKLHLRHTSPMTPSKVHKWKPTWRYKMAVGAVVLLLLLVIVLLHLRDPEANTLEFEMAKVAMQALGVVVIGALVGLAVNRLTEQKVQETAQKNFRRDNLRRQYDTMVSLFDRSLNAYNEVKCIRRSLDARTGPEGNRMIDAKTYDAHMKRLNAQQLEFESLKRTARVWGIMNVDAELNTGLLTLELKFTKIEKYLNNILDEYQRTWPAVRHASTPFPAPPLLVDFVDETGNFRERATRSIRAFETDFVKLQTEVSRLDSQ
ncbi:hypothetical protein [Kocuria sabuli]|uniref:YybH family protein n=1 Tax=Kocuria sabuli TaxID=3071448 RepID=UPI0034D74E72